MYLSASIPSFKCFVRKEFLYNQDIKYKGQFEEGICFGVSSIKNRALGFHVMFNNGGVFWRLPLNSLAHKEDAKPITVGESQLWDNISYNISVTEYEFLKGREASLKTRSGKLHRSTYLFTIDYAESDYAESADEHKCSHILKAEDGNFYSMPNNRILWQDTSFVTKPSVPDWKVNKNIYFCESNEFKTLEEDDNFFYEIKKQG